MKGTWIRAGSIRAINPFSYKDIKMPFEETT